MNTLSENARGALFVLTANLFLIVSDTFAKLLTQDIAVSQLIVVRGVFGCGVALLLCWYFRAFPDATAVRDRFFWLRLLGESVALVAYLSALAHMQIATVMAILQTVPIAVTAGAALFFGTRVGPARWIAIGAGFAGVLLIIRPAMEGFTPWSLAALATVLCLTVRDLSSRAMHHGIHPFATALVSMVTSVPVGLALSQFESWNVMTGKAVLLCVLSALALPCAFAFMVKAMRQGDVAVVMSFRYSLLLFAIVAQLAVFATPIDGPTIAGAAIVVASGVYMLWRT